MQNFQRGDEAIDIDGKPYVLRLTIGALAAIDHKLQIKGPLQLAEKMKEITLNKHGKEDARILLSCLLQPSCSKFDQVDAAIFMPAIARIFERSFGAAYD